MDRLFSTKYRLSVLVFIFFLCSGCQAQVPAAHPQDGEPAIANFLFSPSTFKDISIQAGLSNNRTPEMEMAIGQAWGDYDNDGWVDLYVTDTHGANTLYRNRGNGTFEISPLSIQVALKTVYSAGATFVDYDNDGWKDLYVANWGPDALFRNESGEKFMDVTASAGLGDPGNGKTPSWGDFDKDGFLDLYVANWSCFPQCPRPEAGDLDHLYHNNGDGTFTDVTSLLGPGVNGAAFVSSFVDYDNDGDLDIYTVNDEFIIGNGNKLWRNDGPGCGNGSGFSWCFQEVSKEAGANIKVFGMGLASGDYDNDGDLDFYFSNSGPMYLLQNQGNGTFKNVAGQAGVEVEKYIAWGSVFLDYDNDGRRDLYLAASNTTNGKDISANPLFHNNGNGTFTQVACGSGASDIHASLGVAYADYDRDGWVDLVVGNMDEGYRLLRNQAGELPGSTRKAHWMAFELIGGGPVNRDAVGTRIYLEPTLNPREKLIPGTIQMQDVINGSSMGSGNELVLYFGLGEAASANITVRWPNGLVQKFSNIAANQRYRLEYPHSGTSELHVIDQPGLSRQPTYAPGQFINQFSEAEPFLFLLVLVGVALAAFSIIKPRVKPLRRAWQSGLLAGTGMVMLGCALWLAASTGINNTLPADPHARLAILLERAGVYPPTSPDAPSKALVKLGEALFWDPEISGNRDITCATCHHPLLATGDGLSVSVGTAGVGLGPERISGKLRFLIPRNAPPVFNLGYLEWSVFFWDGRVFNTPHGFDTPVSYRLPAGLDNLLAAQGMFPVTSREEMRGRIGDLDIFGKPNELARIPDFQNGAIWKALTKRLLAIPGYVDLFQAAYPGLPLEEIGFQHAANALSAYQAVTFTFEDSPFDRYIRGDQTALQGAALEGALLFYGKAGCAECHSGPLLTDQNFHNLAVPQLGDGKGRERPLDLGRARETGDDCDRYAFRSPPLRNVALTGPWMHNGAFTTLEATIRHHLDPQGGLQNYDPNQLIPTLRDSCQEDPKVLQSILAGYNPADATPALSNQEIQALLAFMDALTSPTALDLSSTIPAAVPSGLKVGGE